MRRRLATFLPAAVLSIALLVPATAAPALAVEETLVLATEGGEGEEAPGLEPRTADDPDNEFAPDPYEANWTADIGAVLFYAILAAAALLGLGYWLRVARFARDTRQS